MTHLKNTLISSEEGPICPICLPAIYPFFFINKPIIHCLSEFGRTESFLMQTSYKAYDYRES